MIINSLYLEYFLLVSKINSFVGWDNKFPSSSLGRMAGVHAADGDEWARAAWMAPRERCLRKDICVSMQNRSDVPMYCYCQGMYYQGLHFGEKIWKDHTLKKRKEKITNCHHIWEYVSEITEFRGYTFGACLGKQAHKAPPKKIKIYERCQCRGRFLIKEHSLRFEANVQPHAHHQLSSEQEHG